MKTKISTIQALLYKQEKDADDFRILMLTWMQKIEKVVGRPSGEDSGSGVFEPSFTPPPTSGSPTPITIPPVPPVSPGGAPPSGGFHCQLRSRKRWDISLPAWATTFRNGYDCTDPNPGVEGFQNLIIREPTRYDPISLPEQSPILLPINHTFATGELVHCLARSRRTAGRKGCVSGVDSSLVPLINAQKGNFVSCCLEMMKRRDTMWSCIRWRICRRQLRTNCRWGLALFSNDLVLIQKFLREVKLGVGRCEFIISALVFDAGHLDLVLGMEWLKTLGEVTHNWDQSWMRFSHKGRVVQLQGMGNSLGSLAPLHRWLPMDTSALRAAVSVPVHPDSSPAVLSDVQQHDLQVLLAQFAAVLRNPLVFLHLAHMTTVQELLSLGMIRPSKSAFSSPVILVRKKDLSWRMCVDYRALNKATISDKYPIPMVDELLDELHGARFFSKFDLKSGYNQIRMHPESIENTAFRTHDGHYEYLVMPFGLTNAPATFQAVMNDIFRPFLCKMIVVFFDDILIYSPTWSAHVKDLEIALQTLFQHQFVVNQKKCYFGQSSVEYLGYIITGHGVAMDPQKIEAVLAWPIPRQIKGLRGFLGLTGYYRKFVRHYGSIAKPLTDLTKKDAFMWTSDAQLAFDKLKEALVTASVLSLPDFSLLFIVECDASGRGIGAVLMQNRKPIAYFSKALSERNLVKSAYEREIMALVLSVQHWRSYLLGNRFIVYTDRKKLKFLLQQRITSPDQQNWVAKLLGYTFDICYKAGRENRAADALSRRAEEGELKMGVSAPIWVQEAQLIEEEFHQSASGGHSGYYRTYRRLAVNLYWPSMIKRVKAFVRECDICQRCKASTAAPSGLLQPLSIPEYIWEHVSMDFILGLPKSRSFDALLVVVDRLSKYSHFILLKHSYTAKSIAEIFVKEAIRHHEVPKSTVSDRDPLFLSRFWQEIFKSQGTELHMSSAYHPESDGQTEVINRCLETYLRCFAVDQPRTWSLWILWAKFRYNSTFHSTTGKTPFEVVYGRPAPSVVQFVPGEVRVDAVITELLDRDEVLRQLTVQLSRAQTIMKENADKKRRDVQFVTGEWVYVKLKPYRQMSVSSRVHQKLAARFFGPFQIVSKIGPVAYKLDLPPTSRIHPVFHVSLLKKAIQAVVEQGLPPKLETDATDLVFPMAILNRRTVRNQDTEVEQWLVQWSGGTTKEATWEDRTTMENQFPDASLDDKTLSAGGSSDEDSVLLSPNVPKPRVLQVYSRRPKRVEVESG
ncbi:hypothetical protein LXL04_034197 [Taraxacum kok-saghyz]